MAAKILPSQSGPQQLAQFVRRVWSRHPKGFGFLAARRGDIWVEKSFPISGDGVEEFFARYSFRRHDLYFCVNAFRRRRRLGMYAHETCYAHVDIDAADPSLFQPPPTILVSTSPNRWQGVWEFANAVEPKVAENLSRSLAANGDKGGWSITKMLRVPSSLNHKPAYDLPVVTIVRDDGAPIAAWPTASAMKSQGTQEAGTGRVVSAGGGVGRMCPGDEAREPADLAAAMERLLALSATLPVDKRMWLRVHVMQKRDQVWRSDANQSGVDRSTILTKMIRRLHALGMTDGETFALVWQSGWNKFRVDGRSKDDLWSEIDKAYGE